MNGVDLVDLKKIPTGFFLITVIMICIGIDLLLFFIKKQWILVRRKNESNVPQENTKVNQDTNKRSNHIQYSVFKRQ